MYNSYLPSYEEQLLDSNWLLKRKIIINRDHHRCQMCGSHGNKDNPLAVHHRYYKYGVLAWEYNNDTLITLCVNCHSLIHQTISPLCYYNNGERLVLMNFTPCHRCSGSGWFREYKHVHGGICFRCNGQRYEELIHKKEDEIDLGDYFVIDEDSFDLLNPTDNINEIIEICKKGEDYYWANNGVEPNVEEAYKLFRKAALNGNGVAQNYCGLILYKQEDYRRSFRWFVYSAMQGTPQAQYNLSTIFSKGAGSIRENSVLAEKWLELSKTKHNKTVKEKEISDIPDEGTLDFEDYLNSMEEYFKEQSWFYESQETVNTWTFKEFLRYCGASKTVRIYESAAYHSLREGGEDTITFFVDKKRIDIFNYYHHYPIKYVAAHPDEFRVTQQRSGYYYIWKEE